MIKKFVSTKKNINFFQLLCWLSCWLLNFPAFAVTCNLVVPDPTSDTSFAVTCTYSGDTSGADQCSSDLSASLSTGLAVGTGDDIPSGSCTGVDLNSCLPSTGPQLMLNCTSSPADNVGVIGSDSSSPYPNTFNVASPPSFTVIGNGDLNVTITPQNQTVAYNNPAVFTVTPTVGYNVTVSGCGYNNAAVTPGSFTTAALTGACTATFSSTLQTFTVNATAADAHVTVSPQSQTVAYNNSAVFTVTPTTGYNVTVSGCGYNNAAVTPGSFTTAALTGACTATFSSTLQTFTVNATAADAHVTVSPQSQTVAYNNPAVFTVTPTAGYNVTVSGCGYNNTAVAPGSFTTVPLTGTCTATFSSTLQTFAVNATTADAHVTVSPQNQTVAYNNPAVFTVLATNGYNVTVNGCGATNIPVFGTTYTTGSITAACNLVFFSSSGSTVPGMPTNTVATPSNNSAIVQWTAPTQGPVTSYRVNSIPGNFTCTTTTTSCVVGGLSNGLSYVFNVVAINAQGESAISLPSNAITPNPAKGNLFFNVIASGTSNNADIILCLDVSGRVPLSCQRYSVPALNLFVLSTIPNHLYRHAGIKVSPSYQVSGCMPLSNGYCSFSVSDTQSSTLTLVKSFVEEEVDDATTEHEISAKISLHLDSSVLMQNGDVQKLVVKNIGLTSLYSIETVMNELLAFVDKNACSEPLAVGESCELSLQPGEKIGQSTLNVLAQNAPAASVDIQVIANGSTYVNPEPAVITIPIHDMNGASIKIINNGPNRAYHVRAVLPESIDVKQNDAACELIEPHGGSCVLTLYANKAYAPLHEVRLVGDNIQANVTITLGFSVDQYLVYFSDDNLMKVISAREFTSSWSNLSSAVKTSLEDGFINTQALVEDKTHCTQKSCAASMCQQLGKDWYLPAIDELGLIKKALCPDLTHCNLGEFLPTYYLSSTQDSELLVHGVDFSSGAKKRKPQRVKSLARCVKTVNNLINH